MSRKIRELIDTIETMKHALRDEIAKEEAKIDYDIQHGKVVFEKDVIAKQHAYMKSSWQWLKEVPLIQFLTAPIIYGMVFPALFLDVTLFVYTRTVASVFKLKFDKRSDYIVFDRQYLGYLNFFEKLNCVYCSYFNGLMFYSGSVARTTELYFCPIKHAKRVAYGEDHFEKYLPYGDAEHYHEKLAELRAKYTQQENEA